MTGLAAFIVIACLVVIVGVGIGMLVASGMNRLENAAEPEEEDVDDRSG
jgi:hypothetical protein